jgi:GAF domain-containing protein
VGLERRRERLQILLRDDDVGDRGQALDVFDRDVAGHGQRVYEACDSPSMSFEQIVGELLADVGASRTTLRLRAPDAFFPVVAEALAPGIGSIAADTSIDLAASPTFKFLEGEQRLLIQADLLDADPAPPKELIEHYGARAQMLAPIVRDEELVGILSVHYAPGPRVWTDEEIGSLERASARVLGELG